MLCSREDYSVCFAPHSNCPSQILRDITGPSRDSSQDKHPLDMYHASLTPVAWQGRKASVLPPKDDEGPFGTT